MIILKMDADAVIDMQPLYPGRQKSYILRVNSAKNEETKRRRILSSREKILAGKGALER